MTSRPRRAPLFDLSNLTPAGDALRSASETFDPINTKTFLSQTASPASSEPVREGGYHEAASTLDPVCRTPLSAAPMAMEVDESLSTPQPSEPDGSSSLSTRGERFIIYSRRQAAAPAYLTMSCPPLHNHLKERNELEPSTRKKLVKRGLSGAALIEDGRSKAPKRSRRHSLPNMQPKRWLPEEFIAAQRSHFAEVDAFKLVEEEGELSDED